MADGIDYEWIAVSAHEIGHLVAWRAGGFAAGPATVTKGLFGGVGRGDCPSGARGVVDEHNIDAYLVGCAAGAVTQKRCSKLYLRGRCGSWWSTGCSADRAAFRRMRRSWRRPMSWGQAERKAAALLERHARRLDELTIRIATTGAARY
ncbi:hypothetical protein Ae168Ps1_6370c [Pseudonocardia sp. Ae168_Ps1]|uniref:hypothetical protein n=1 Tax=unclassified Pseudonocardia TaxID=2619320 RepID=UPI0009624853|nr:MULTISPECIES: hypothetical protein [unclassified Pseudonocardia]OLL69887.1 hypothetical protein Ae150APs1_6197 [Pseudonocardia sp. Ae150A_Ps1]OLL70133.1 hypothetical protein Ae168Ps1_6370c [Pseudonocardia sp. Ae168_Ps1]OLL70404.1 hypothetical protein Ae263Ps1_6348c [Pseudonocardia sp. Ae263_Ps1]OLL89185.1 hypothetical protein Ae356Ps1_6213c [Pseudonocardia sp. Ae356_Ps1]